MMEDRRPTPVHILFQADRLRIMPGIGKGLTDAID